MSSDPTRPAAEPRELSPSDGVSPGVASSDPIRPAAPAPAGPILVEVVARLGDRVIDVQHVGQRDEPAISRAGLFTVGGCAAALGLWLVAAGIAAPAPAPDPTGEHEPAPRGGAAGLGALLILLGVVPAAIAVGRPRHVPRDRYVIGEGPDVQLPVGLPAGVDRAGVPLVLALERQWVLDLVPGMTGEIHDGARTLALADLAAQGRRSYAVPAGARCEAALGPLRFEIHAVEGAAFVPERRPVDRLYWASNLGAVALIGGALWLGEPGVPGEIEVEEVAQLRARAVQYLVDVPPPPPPPERPPPPPPVRKDRSVKAAAARPAPAPPASAPPELAVVDPNLTSGRIAPRGMRRGIQRDNEKIRGYGLLADEGFNEGIAETAASAQEGLLGYDNAEDRKMWAEVLAAPVTSRPFGGLELAETERGGGIHGPKKARPPAKRVTIDLEARRRPASAEERAVARTVVTVELEQPFVRGELSQYTAERYMRKNQAGLVRCFKEQVGASDRVGTVIFRLKLNGDGRVTGAGLDFGGSKLGDIGPCIEKVARSWTFPAPTDGQPATIVIEALFSAKHY